MSKTRGDPADPEIQGVRTQLPQGSLVFQGSFFQSLLHLQGDPVGRVDSLARCTQWDMVPQGSTEDTASWDIQVDMAVQGSNLDIESVDIQGDMALQGSRKDTAVRDIRLDTAVRESI